MDACCRTGGADGGLYVRDPASANTPPLFPYDAAPPAALATPRRRPIPWPPAAGRPPWLGIATRCMPSEPRRASPYSGVHGSAYCASPGMLGARLMPIPTDEPLSRQYARTGTEYATESRRCMCAACATASGDMTRSSGSDSAR
eukprot:353200-Chlamydomonas_euryale.AAC.3